MTPAARFVCLGLLVLLASPAILAGDEGGDAPWDIEEAHGPTRTVSFTTDRGTWISLDVHPEGDRLVFSLLGDLYLLPLEGGTARRITEGVAYDVQPRFSPDGTLIAFASDRGGTENLWVCDLDGENARQVSREKGTFVNGPAWSPDGDYLLGRKRLTDMSSLGTVELWMWHRKGGEGVPITSRDTQPDAADAWFSPDGRFLYFSARDARYRYDRNVYQGIWQIKRFDRRTGQTVPVTGEVGGAAAPALSPDGRTLAFTRRHEARTVLELMDVATGDVRRLAGGLTRDNQQGFAFHGVFPGYAWTPDGRSVVATAGGKIWKWDATSGERTPVPFEAEVEQRITEALRPARRVGVDPVRARILRWPVEAPGGGYVVFSALGRLWTADLSGGEPRRLTGADVAEYSPAFAPDGSRLAYVTWDDDEGGHVWSLPVGPDGRATGAPRRLTEIPGHYANPSFSPDGETLVLLRGSGATLRDHDHLAELWHEIRLMDAGGGPSTYVIGTANRGPNRRMASPRFSPDGTRLYYVEDEAAGRPGDPPKTVLVSVQRDGTDRRVHLRWTRAEEAVVSPDGRWVAFNESHDAWVTALPRVGDRTVDVGLEGGALPVARLSREGGEWLGWAEGGRTVTWVSGPVYHRLSLEDAFPAPEPEAATEGGAEERKKKRKKAKEAEREAEEEGDGLPESESVEIVLTAPRDRPQETVAYTGARVITMRGDEVLEDGTVVVEGDRIVSVGAAGDVDVPSGARTVDLSGRTIIPGLFDEHAHLHYSTLDIFPERPWKYRANLAYGITSAHDPSASTHEVFAQAEMVEAGLMVGPRIFSTGFILYGADNPGRAIVDSLDDARRHVRRMKNLGAISVKSYMQPRRDQRQWLLEAAREEGLLVMPEGGGDLEADMTMILDGHTTLEHSLPVAPLYDDVVRVFGESGTAYAPTLLVAYGGLSGEHWFYQHDAVHEDPRLRRHVPADVIDARARVLPVMAPDDEWHHIDVAAGAKAVLDAGGRVCLGGHGQLQGLGPHWEIRVFVQGGMTPLEALRAATLHPAEALGLDRDLGSLDGGKLADFVVLEGNPLEDIRLTETVALVVKNGRAYTPAELALE